jgi:hypothetical protein
LKYSLPMGVNVESMDSKLSSSLFSKYFFIFDLINTWILQIFKSSTWSFDLSFIIMSRKGFWWTSLTTLMDQEAS